MSALPQKRTYATYSINLSALATIACGRARSRGLCNFAIDDQFVFRWRMNRRLLPFENAIEVASNNALSLFPGVQRSLRVVGGQPTVFLSSSSFNKPIQTIKIPTTSGIQYWNVTPNTVCSSIKYCRHVSTRTVLDAPRCADSAKFLVPSVKTGYKSHVFVGGSGLFYRKDMTRGGPPLCHCGFKIRLRLITMFAPAPDIVGPAVAHAL